MGDEEHTGEGWAQVKGKWHLSPKRQDPVFSQFRHIFVDLASSLGDSLGGVLGGEVAGDCCGDSQLEASLVFV